MSQMICWSFCMIPALSYPFFGGGYDNLLLIELQAQGLCQDLSFVRVTANGEITTAAGVVEGPQLNPSSPLWETELASVATCQELSQELINSVLACCLTKYSSFSPCIHRDFWQRLWLAVGSSCCQLDWEETSWSTTQPHRHKHADETPHRQEAAEKENKNEIFDVVRMSISPLVRLSNQYQREAKWLIMHAIAKWNYATTDTCELLHTFFSENKFCLAQLCDRYAEVWFDILFATLVHVVFTLVCTLLIRFACH